MVMATFSIIPFAVFVLLESSPAAARITHATIIIIKHTTRIIDIINFVKIPIIYGNTFVGLAPSWLYGIQFQITGKFVLSFTPQHQSLHTFPVHPVVDVHPVPVVQVGSISCAFTVQVINHVDNISIQPHKYDNNLFFINHGIKK